MKEFHPSGVAINNEGKIIYYLLSQTSGKEITVKNPIADTLILDNSEFEKYVSEHRVQLFQIKNGEPTVSYTDEELNLLKKKVKDFVPLTGDDYFNSEAVFDSTELLGRKEITAFSFVACREISIGSGVIVQGAILCNGFERGHLNELKSLLKKQALVCSPVTNNMFLCNWLLPKLEELMRNLKNGFNLSVSTRTLENIGNSIYKHKMLGFKNLDVYRIKSLARVLNSYSNVLTDDTIVQNQDTTVKRMNMFK